MNKGLLKIIAVALAFTFVKIAELSFHTDYYYAALSAAFVATACFSILFAVITKSKSLLIYASIYVVGAFLFAFMLNYDLSIPLYYFIYKDEVNFSLLVIIADSFIMLTGGINVIYRLYTLRYHGGSGDDIFDARVGLHKWAR